MNNISIYSWAFFLLSSCGIDDSVPLSFDCHRNDALASYAGEDGTVYEFRAVPGNEQVMLRIKFKDKSKDSTDQYVPIKYDKSHFSISDVISVSGYIDKDYVWEFNDIRCKVLSLSKNEMEYIYKVECKNKKDIDNSEYTYSSHRGITSIKFSFLKKIDKSDIVLSTKFGLAAPCP